MSANKLPDGWTRVRLGEVITRTSKRCTPEVSPSVRWIGADHLEEGDLSVRRWSTTDDPMFPPTFYFSVPSGSVLLHSRNPKKVAILPFDAITGEKLFCLAPVDASALDYRLLAYQLQSDHFHEFVGRWLSGSVNKFLNWTALARYEFALPPFDEQSRIADLLSAFDAQLTALAAASEAAERAALSVGRSVLASANGSTVPLGDVADVVGGVTKDGGRVSTELSVVVPYLRVANVLRGRIDVSNLAEITVPPEVVSKLRLLPGDVLINEGGDRDKLGRGWIWDGSTDPCIHQNHVFRARVHDPRFSALLVAWMANFGNPVWFERNGRQSTNLASISLSAVKRFPLPVLHDGERERFDAVISRQLRLSESITKQIDSATDARKSVLEQLLGGPHVQ